MVKRIAYVLRLFLVPLLLLGACTFAEEPPFPPRVNVGSAPSSPGWNFRDHTGLRTGFDHQLTQWLGAELDFVPVEVDVVAENRETALKEQLVLMVVATYSISDHRLRQVEIVGPYMRSHQGIMVRAEEVDRYRTLSDLEGKTVCATSGSTSLDQLRTDLEGVNINIVTKTVYEECRLALHAGSVDVVSTDQLLLYGMAVEDAGVAIPPGIAFGKEERYGVGLPLGDRVKCEQIKVKLKKYIVDGTWKRHFEENFPNVSPDNHRPDPNSISGCRSAPSTTR